MDVAPWRRDLGLERYEVGTGHGGDILGHPLEARAWLANAMAARGRQLKAGELLPLGSAVETKWIAAGDLVEIEIEGLGRASCEFA